MFILLSADAAKVPVVCVAFGGGSGTLETIRCAIKRGTPAIVVKVFLKLCFCDIKSLSLNFGII